MTGIQLSTATEIITRPVVILVSAIMLTTSVSESVWAQPPPSSRTAEERPFISGSLFLWPIGGRALDLDGFGFTDYNHPVKGSIDEGPTSILLGGRAGIGFYPGGQTPIEYPDLTVRATRFGFGGGADVLMPVGAGFSAAWSARIHWTGTLTVQLGAGLSWGR